MQSHDAQLNVPEVGEERPRFGAEVFPVTHSLLAPEALLAEVARAYPIDRPVDCALVRSYVNDVYAIATGTGHYILKVYRAGWRSRSEIAHELDALAHLAAKGIAAASALPRRDGERIGVLRAPEGDRHAVLFRYAEGVKPAPPFTAMLYHHFGQATARLHGALDDFTSPHARAPLDLAYLLDRPLAALRPWLARRCDDWAFLVYVAEKVRARVTTLATAGLDWGVCHGDLSLDNVHVTPDHRITFYDLDSGGPGWRASDPYGVFQYQPRDNWDAFLSGYRAVRAFGSTDVAAVPYFAAANGIWQMGNRVRNLAAWHGRGLVTEAYFDDQLARWRRWDAEHLGDR